DFPMERPDAPIEPHGLENFSGPFLPERENRSVLFDESPVAGFRNSDVRMRGARRHAAGTAGRAGSPFDSSKYLRRREAKPETGEVGDDGGDPSRITGHERKKVGESEILRIRTVLPIGIQTRRVGFFF